MALMQRRTLHPRGFAARPVCMNRAGGPVTVHAILRATFTGNAWSPSPSYKAIKHAREPVMLDAYEMPRATVIGTANAHRPHSLRGMSRKVLGEGSTFRANRSGIARADVAGNDNAGSTLPQYPALLTELA